MKKIFLIIIWIIIGWIGGYLINEIVFVFLNTPSVGVNVLAAAIPAFGRTVFVILCTSKSLSIILNKDKGQIISEKWKKPLVFLLMVYVVLIIGVKIYNNLTVSTSTVVTNLTKDLQAKKTSMYLVGIDEVGGKYSIDTSSIKVLGGGNISYTVYENSDKPKYYEGTTYFNSVATFEINCSKNSIRVKYLSLFTKNDEFIKTSNFDNSSHHNIESNSILNLEKKYICS